jgi:hypothetical protein
MRAALLALLLLAGVIDPRLVEPLRDGMSNEERLAPVARQAPTLSPFMGRRLAREQERARSIERRADLTEGREDCEALATSIDEQLAILGQVRQDLDVQHAALWRGLVAVGWTPGTSIVEWVGCSQEELRLAIEEAQR